MKDIFSKEEKLELLDLRQIELIEKAQTRLAADLSQWKKNTQAFALLERETDITKSLSEDQIASMSQNGEPVDRSQLFEMIDEKNNGLKHERMRLIVAMKSIIWNASNALKNDHARRKEIQVIDDEEVIETEEQSV